MKKFLKICLIIFVCLVILGGAWAALTWFNVIPNWFGVGLFCSHYDVKGYNYDKVTECRKKCEKVEGYDDLSLKSWFIGKYGEVPMSGRINIMYYCRPNEYCPSIRVDSVEEAAGLYYETWLQETFSSDEIEKINNYKSCFKSCGYHGYRNYNENCTY